MSAVIISVVSIALTHTPKVWFLIQAIEPGRLTPRERLTTSPGKSYVRFDENTVVLGCSYAHSLTSEQKQAANLGFLDLYAVGKVRERHAYSTAHNFFTCVVPELYRGGILKNNAYNYPLGGPLVLTQTPSRLVSITLGG